jgi:diguanylate cyclase (GGDEF)-like protein
LARADGSGNYVTSFVLELISSRIGRRLATTVGLAMAVLGLGGLLVVLEHGARTHDESTALMLEAIGVTIATSFSTYDARLGRHPIADVAAELATTERAIDLEVVAPSGKVLWSVDAKRDPKDTRGANDGPKVHLPLAKRASCLPCHASSPDPIATLELAADRERLLGGRVAYETLAAVIGGLIILFVTMLILLLMNRMVLQPLGRLVRVMSRVEEGDFFARAEVQGNDEIGLLASTFNKLVSKITDLRVERIDTERELSDVRGELLLKAELAEKSHQLAEANRTLQDRFEQLTFLYAIGRELAGVLDPDPLLERLGQMVHTKLAVPEFSVLLIDAAGARGTIATAIGFPPETVIVGRAFLLEGSVSADAAAKRSAIYVPDLGADARRISYRTTPANRGSLFCVPVIYQDRLLGTFNFASPEKDAFSTERRELFTAVANQAALALANAQLFRQTLELSRTDGLTGVPNRRELESRLALEWSHAERYSEPLSVLLIDLDSFQKYNENHGRSRGDELLRRIARILEANVRKVDALGRYGGDEFLVVLPRSTKEQAETVADKLRRSIEQADFEGGYMQPLGRVTVSAGVATAPDDAKTVEELLHAADDAIFSAKDSGRNRVASAKPQPGTPRASAS